MAKSRTRERRQVRQQTGRSRSLIVGGIAAAVVVVAAVAILLINQSQQPDVDVNAVADTTVTYPNQGQEHIVEGAPHVDYNSNPPTSGPHYATPIRAGVYQQEVPDELLVHNLEHGHIWLSYQNADDSATIDQLSAIQAQFPQWVVVTYRPENDTPVAVAAWTRLLTLDQADPDEILAFIVRYRNRAPESIAG